MAALSEAEALARAWIDGWNAGKPDDIPLANDFSHTSPFGTVSGRDDYLAWVKPLAAQNVTSLNIVKTMAEGKACAVWFEMGTPNGVVNVCDWVETQDGQIVAITSFYDASNLPARD